MSAVPPTTAATSNKRRSARGPPLEALSHSALVSPTVGGLPSAPMDNRVRPLQPGSSQRKSMAAALSVSFNTMPMTRVQTFPSVVRAEVEPGHSGRSRRRVSSRPDQSHRSLRGQSFFPHGHEAEHPGVLVRSGVGRFHDPGQVRASSSIG
jgi:hypothetical protein